MSSHEQQLLAYAKKCVTPAYSYCKAKLDNDLKPTLDAFKAAGFFSSCKVAELKPTAADIDTLKSLPFCNSEAVFSDLKSELPRYLAAAEAVSSRANVVDWWKLLEDDLPHWAQSCKLVLLVEPSSAAAERAFFQILSNSFSEKQESSLEDYIELSVMLQYNYRN